MELCLELEPWSADGYRDLLILTVIGEPPVNYLERRIPLTRIPIRRTLSLAITGASRMSGRLPNTTAHPRQGVATRLG